MPKMTKTDLRTVVEQAITHSTWQDSHEDKDNFVKAMNSYYGKNSTVQEDGLSNAMSHDVADMTEAVVAQIMPAFDFDEVAVFKPHGSNDFEQSRLESRVVNSNLRDKNHGYTVIQQALRNALLLRNGLLEVVTERKTWTETRSYEDVGPLELQQITRPTSPEQTVEVLDFEEGPEGTLASLQVRNTFNLKRLTIMCVDTIELVMTQDWTDPSLKDCPLVGKHVYITRSDLIEMGVPKAQVKRLRAGQTDSSTTSSARDPDGGTRQLNYQSADKSIELIECFELYMLVDFDGDGVAERRRVLYGGGLSSGEVLQNDPWRRVPYASGTPFLQSNRWRGLSLYDKLCELEGQKTEALRQLLNNLELANNAELLVNDDLANMEDLKKRRPGGMNRVEDVERSVRELVFNSNVQESLAFLNYADQVRSERGGASLDLQAAQMQLAGDTAHGIERQYTSKEQLSQLMTRTLAETLIRDTFLLIHDTMRDEFPETQSVQVGNDFVDVRPGQWPHREELNIIAGMSSGERRDRRAALDGVLVQQEKLMDKGKGDGWLVSDETYHAALNDWTAAGGVQNPGRYWVDPRTPGSQQAKQAAMQQRAQAQKQQAQTEQQLVAAPLMVEQQKQQSALRQAGGELQYDYWKGTLDAIVKLATASPPAPVPAEAEELIETGEANAT